MSAELRLPGWAWLLLPTLALWPLWLWSARRLSDGSDDPYGVVALGALLLVLWRERRVFVATPRRGWLLAAGLLAALAGLSQGLWSPLPRAALGVLAVLSAAMALRAPAQPRLAWLGLGLLTLPLLSSLQFYLGYPLRLLTAEVSAWLLRAGGLAVERQGSALDVAGQLVMVDAPCSGIQMAWVAYFIAFASAAWLRLSDSSLVRRLPLLGCLVLAGNIVRNSLLVLQETGRLGGPGWLHEAIGLLVFAAVCALVLRIVSAGAPAAGAGAKGVAAVQMSAVWQGALALLFVLLGSWPLLRGAAVEPAPVAQAVEWPQRFAGRELRPLALSPVELRFAAQFPGAIGRFSDGERVISLRRVERPTRKLHPSSDCFRGLGFRIGTQALERRGDASGLQRCFVASGEGGPLRVCEYIEDAAGRSFSDHSAWYWSALAGESPGPWLAVTTAQPLR
ncbi:exosortase Q [Pseudomonas sp. CAU 1711]|uniref:exosortase Q n=1 Tax=Pseudomonas sp. CAU 1711 TaxID=3140356 RepID=UPI003260264A